MTFEKILLIKITKKDMATIDILKLKLTPKIYERTSMASIAKITENRAPDKATIIVSIITTINILYDFIPCIIFKENSLALS